MIPKECKRLIEVDFPIAEVSKHSAREKSIRHGHPSTLHLWWARRPLAACRAVLLGLLFPDPCDLHCPTSFKEKAKEILAEVQKIPKTDRELQQGLLKFIGDFANWDLSSNATYINAARKLVAASSDGKLPLVVDPFAGGGSIPLEAVRVGCDAFASDLNPVACLILKTMLEFIPRGGFKLADEFRKLGQKINKEIREDLAEYYPKYDDGYFPIGYLWARTVKCESPNCGAEIPLIRTFWLSKKSGANLALRTKIIPLSNNAPYVDFEIFIPKNEKDVTAGTVSHAKAKCLCCGSILSPERVRAQLREQRGGADVIYDEKGDRLGGARLIVIVTSHQVKGGKHYRLAKQEDYRATYKAKISLDKNISKTKLPDGQSQIPDEKLPRENTLGLRLPNYGVTYWSDLFSYRQKRMLLTLSNKIRELRNGNTISDAMLSLLALSMSRSADYNSSNCSLNVVRDVVRNTWARNALPIVWDYYEAAPTNTCSGSFDNAIEWIVRVIEYVSSSVKNQGQVQLADASKYPLPDDSAQIWITDPPYYDAIGYSESSDFFFVWLKRLLPDYILYRDPFDKGNKLTPKIQECIQDDSAKKVMGLCKDKNFFEKTISRAFEEGHRISAKDGIGCIVFAHKSTEGWEALLSGIVKGGWEITASWPIETEMKSKMSGSQGGEKKAMLLASIHLICRPRSINAEVGDWGNILGALPKRIHDWMDRLSDEKIRGADLVFSCIGPALELFSKYSKVEKADGREVTLAEYLEKVWEVVGRTALEQILGAPEARAHNGISAGALEEDARLTALFLWTLQSAYQDSVEENGHEEDETKENEEEEAKSTVNRRFSLIFDVARRFAQPLGIHLEEWDGRIIEIEKGIVRLFSISERAKVLFGEDGADLAADSYEKKIKSNGQTEFNFFQEIKLNEMPEIKKQGKTKRKNVPEESFATRREATTLDRVHAAMLLQKAGKANALRNLIKDEQDRSPGFLRLANALSALYPKESEEKRLVDAMLLAVPK